MHPSPNILRTTVVGCETKDELSKQFAGVNSGCKIEVFCKEKGVTCCDLVEKLKSRQQRNETKNTKRHKIQVDD